MKIWALIKFFSKPNTEPDMSRPCSSRLSFACIGCSTLRLVEFVSTSYFDLFENPKSLTVELQHQIDPEQDDL